MSGGGEPFRRSNVGSEDGKQMMMGMGSGRRRTRAGALAFAAVGLAIAAGAGLAAQRGATAPIYDAQVVATYPHSTDAFCQGLEITPEGTLYEGTGLRGQSMLRKVDLATGKVLQQSSLAPDYFGEGITVWGDRIYQLTWESRVGFIYDRETFKPLGQFRYSGEGWGLTHDDESLIMSDGTSTIRFLDPKTLKVTRRIRVSDHGRAIDQLNELEYIDGEIYANVWNTAYIARIDPKTGEVTSWIDLSRVEPAQRSGSNAVLNGIARDPRNGKLYVTGKNWSDLFEIKLTPRR